MKQVYNSCFFALQSHTLYNGTSAFPQPSVGLTCCPTASPSASSEHGNRARLLPLLKRRGHCLLATPQRTARVINVTSWPYVVYSIHVHNVLWLKNTKSTSNHNVRAYEPTHPTFSSPQHKFNCSRQLLWSSVTVIPSWETADLSLETTDTAIIIASIFTSKDILF